MLQDLFFHGLINLHKTYKDAKFQNFWTPFDEVIAILAILAIFRFDELFFASTRRYTDQEETFEQVPLIDHGSSDRPTQLPYQRAPDP